MIEREREWILKIYKKNELLENYINYELQVMNYFLKSLTNYLTISPLDYLIIQLLRSSLSK